MVLLCGIEEAGRGPLIGPMVMCGVVIDEKDEFKLAAIGVKDSKLLTPLSRERIHKKIIGLVKDFKLEIISPEEIDAALQSATLNLNWLEARKSADIINYLNPDKVILDCPSPNCRVYTFYVKKHLKNKKIEVKGEHKADMKYLVVGAASIIAKVIRDQKIEEIKKEIGIDFGSGYIADERTLNFLKRYHTKYPHIFRKEWAPFKKVLQEKNQKKLGEC